jgi:hypothetical protein
MSACEVEELSTASNISNKKGEYLLMMQTKNYEVDIFNNEIKIFYFGRLYIQV